MRTRTFLLGVVVAGVAAAAVSNRDRLDLDHLGPERVGLDRATFDRLGLDRLHLERYGLARLIPGETVAAAPAAPPPPPAFVMPVPVVSVVKASVPIDLDYAGRTESIRAITLQAKVSAFVTEQHAPDGADVKAGDLLYKLDPRDFQVALDQANAQIERDNAAVAYQTSNFQRGDALSKSGWLAKDSFDQRASTMREAEASVSADRAVARAAQLNLDYSNIHAPFAGRLGRNQAPVGTLVSSAGTVLNTLVQLDPLYVTFNPSETDLAAIEAAKQAGPVAVVATVPGTDTAAHPGSVSFVDNNVDRSTGTVTARATIANVDETLLPGQYVRVRVHLRDQPDALLVPQVAIGSSQLGKYVYVVGAGEHVEQKLVTLGVVKGPLVAVFGGGIAAGDRVITGNLQKIGPGMPVKALPEGPPPS